MNLTETIKAAGVVGQGGAGFPTHVKLSAKAEYFIVNAAECEPLIETDKYLCRTFPDRVIAATIAVAEHLEAKHAVIALKAKYAPEIQALEASIAKASAPVELFFRVSPSLVRKCAGVRSSNGRRLARLLKEQQAPTKKRAVS